MDEKKIFIWAFQMGTYIYMQWRRIRQQYCSCHDGHCEEILYYIEVEQSKYNDFTL